MKPDRDFWVRESGPVERGSALLYVLAAIGFGIAAFRSRGLVRVFSVFWLLLSIVSAGEEASWLQHELGYATPEFMADANVQGEFNFHNLRGLQGGALLEEADEDGPWLGLLGSQNLFQLGFAAYFLVLPLLALLPAVTRSLERFSVPYLGLGAVAVVWIPIAAALAVTLFGGAEVKSLAAEIRELHYAVAFFVLALLLNQTVVRSGRTVSVPSGRG